MSVIPGGSDRYIASWARWETIRYAIDDNGRTARLIMLLLVPILGAVLSLLIMVLTSHYGLGPGSVPRQANPATTASAAPSRTVRQAGPAVGRPSCTRVMGVASYVEVHVAVGDHRRLVGMVGDRDSGGDRASSQAHHRIRKG